RAEHAWLHEDANRRDRIDQVGSSVGKLVEATCLHAADAAGEVAANAIPFAEAGARVHGRSTEADGTVAARRKSTPDLTREWELQILQPHIAALDLGAEFFVPLQRQVLYAIAGTRFVMLWHKAQCTASQIEEVGLAEHALVELEHDELALSR